MMRNTIACFLLIFGLSFLGFQMATATSFIQTNQFLIGETDVLDDDLWLSANSIEIKGQAKNDLFLMATAGSWKTQDEKEGNILLAGQLENDVWAVGNTISLTGAIQDHARLLARIITVNGSVSNNSIFAGNSIHLTQTARMGRDVLVLGENVIMEGNVDGNLIIFCKSVTLAGKCAGNVRMAAGDIVVLPQTQITGDLIYSSPAELVLDKGVVLRGRLIREAEEISKAERKPLISWPSQLLQSWLFTGALCVGALMMFLFPVFLNESAAQIQTSTWKCMAVGFVAVCLVPMACFFLAISLIGLPLALLTALTFIVLSYLCKISVALVIGTLITRRKLQGPRMFPVMGLGLVLLYAAAGSGLAGSIVSFLIICLGLGGIILALLARRSVSAP